MSKSTNHTEKVQVAGYGLHYHANNQLIPNATDQIVYQSLIDIVRKQLASSLDNQTVMLSMNQLSRLTARERSHTLPGCLKRLEGLGLLKQYKNGLLINCDEYVTLVRLYETLPDEKKDQLSKDFSQKGIAVLKDYNTCVKLRSREELLGMSGSSIVLNDAELRNVTQFPASTNENCVTLRKGVRNLTHIHDSETENCATLRNQVGNVTQFDDSEHKNCATLRTQSEGINWVMLRSLADLVAKMVESFSIHQSFEEYYSTISCVKSPNFVIDALKVAFSCGKFPESFFKDLQNMSNVTQEGCVMLLTLASKTEEHYSTVIIRDKNKYKGDDPLKNEIQTEEENENFQDNIQKGFEGFGKVEILDLDKPSEEIEEDFKENDDISQLKLKRAERQLRERNSYRNKPFIKVERAKEIVDCLDEVVKSPVDFFIYQFWWGIFDLYCEHYHPSTRINEEGEIEDEPQLSDWKEMIGAALPQDEIYSIAQNVYEDMIGAIEQGKYVYGDDNEWEVSFGFTTFQDFNPYEIFQWSPCTMQDKSVPALKVAIDRFYDIEANDVFTPSKGCKVDKKTKNSQNKKLINLILSADDTSLSPMESAIKSFYRDFVVSGDDNIIDEFTDGKGTVLESGGGLPDHLLKPWCYNLSSVRYNEFTSVLCNKYKPCDGVHKKAYIFSAENVVEWNERNGYTDTIAHEALQ